MASETREVVRELELRDLLLLAERVAERHRMKVGEILSSRSALQARARRELWSALYDIMPSYSWIGRLTKTPLQLAASVHDGAPSGPIAVMAASEGSAESRSVPVSLSASASAASAPGLPGSTRTLVSVLPPHDAMVHVRSASANREPIVTGLPRRLVPR